MNMNGFLADPNEQQKIIFVDYQESFKKYKIHLHDMILVNLNY